MPSGNFKLFIKGPGDGCCPVRISFLLLLIALLFSCTRMTEPPPAVLYSFVETWGKDYAGSSGPGQGDGTSGSAPGAFNRPIRSRISGGNILVLDAGNKRVQKFTPDGLPSSFADQTSAFANTFGSEGITEGKFLSPADMVCSDDGRIFIADAENMNVQVFSPDATFLARLCLLKGSAPWPTNAPGGYLRPTALAIDNAGRLYVADTARSAIDRYTPGLILDATWGTDGSLVREEFSRIVSLACADEKLTLLEPTRIRVLSQTGGFPQTVFDAFGYAPEKLSQARGMEIFDGKIFVTDASFVKIFTDEFVYEGSFCGIPGSRPGETLSPSGITVFGKKAFLCDTENNRIQVFERR